ncbi:MAG: fluoride efflux transporter CrcB [Verrucomicrobia bacterium]|nr:fluoride efflux transporter CrcB [Verrucomicrobiota bacterium]
MNSYFIVTLGGGLGALARFVLSAWIARRFGETFPLGTLVINVSGSFLIGLVATAAGDGGRYYLSAAWRQFLMIGVFGGYTTFSSFSLQTLNLALDGEWLAASANAVLSLALCLFAVWLGHALALRLNAPR